MKQEEIVSNFVEVLDQIKEMQAKKTDLSRQLEDLGLFTTLKAIALVTSRAILAPTSTPTTPDSTDEARYSGKHGKKRK